MTFTPSEAATTNSNLPLDHKTTATTAPHNTHPASATDVRRGVMPMRGPNGKPIHSKFASKSPTSGNLSYQGGSGGYGVIRGRPRVYVVYWGNQWGSASADSQGNYTFSKDPQGLAPYQQRFFKGLGTGGETWSGVMTQYCDLVPKGSTSCPASNVAHVGYPQGGALAGVWYDNTSPAPATATHSQIEQEAIAAAKHFNNVMPGANEETQYVVTSPTGTNPDNYRNSGDCAWHADTTSLPWSSDDVAYTNMPYLPDVGSTCGSGNVNSGNALDGVSIVGGHEYAETLTDAFIGGGWCGTDCFTDENGDKCTWGLNGGTNQNISLTTGTFAVQPTWSNDANGGHGGCIVSHPIITDPPPSHAGSKILIVGDSISNGVLGDYSWRYRLWQNLQSSNTSVQFVGHRYGTENPYDDPSDLATVNGQPLPSDNYNNPTDGYYQQGIDSTFTGLGASHHNALWGWSYGMAKNYIAQDVSAYQPDYMLVELGFNDLAFYTNPSDTLANAKALIDNARAVDPNVKILVANVVHRTALCGWPNLNSAISSYNSSLTSAIPSWSTSKSPVYLADISSGYDPSNQTYDGLHPNGVGEYQIADAFSTALANHFGLGSVPGSPPTSVPSIALSTPASIGASIASQGLLLQWSRVYGAAGYKVFERDITGNPNPLPAYTELPLALPGDHWYAGWATPGHTFQYEVAAARGNNESSPSAATTITMPASEPTADPPTNISVTPSGGTTSISLSWSPPSGNPNDNGITGYEVLWADANPTCPGQVVQVAMTTGTSYTITGLTSGHEYYLALATRTAAGLGPAGAAPAAIVGMGAPGAPTIAAGPNRTLTWSPVSGATGYWIYMFKDIWSPWQRLPFEVQAGWNGSLTPGLYRITAANGSLESAPSNSVLLSLSNPTVPPRTVQPTRPSGPPPGMPPWLPAAPNAPLIPSNVG